MIQETNAHSTLKIEEDEKRKREGDRRKRRSGGITKYGILRHMEIPADEQLETTKHENKSAERERSEREDVGVTCSAFKEFKAGTEVSHVAHNKSALPPRDLSLLQKRKRRHVLLGAGAERDVWRVVFVRVLACEGEHPL